MIEHVFIHESLKNTIIKRGVEDRIRKGRPETEYTTQIMKDTNKRKYNDQKELIYNGETWKTAVN